MGAMELVLILAVVLLIFGATRLPGLARSAGKAPEEFKAGLADAPEGQRRPPAV
jgi:TatA/E family protein of Tat protein translocase